LPAVDAELLVGLPKESRLVVLLVEASVGGCLVLGL
jgi:hypothetical protein